MTKGVVNDTTAHAQKCDIEENPAVIYKQAANYGRILLQFSH